MTRRCPVHLYLNLCCHVADFVGFSGMLRMAPSIVKSSEHHVIGVVWVRSYFPRFTFRAPQFLSSSAYTASNLSQTFFLRLLILRRLFFTLPRLVCGHLLDSSPHFVTPPVDTFSSSPQPFSPLQLVRHGLVVTLPRLASLDLLKSSTFTNNGSSLQLHLTSST